MKKSTILAALVFTLFLPKIGDAQIDESKMGGWYMYFYNTTFKEGPWGIQGDLQVRNWNVAGDLEQLLIRSGITYKPVGTNIKFTLGYGHVTTGAYGDDKSTTTESRIYQEALYPAKIGNRFYLNHRFRYEQRFVQNQDFRTRFRYNLFLNVPLNNTEMADKTIYLSLYNEIFINGERSTGNGNEVEIFDRNRFYYALGYMLKKGMKLQFGAMIQSTDNWTKDQLQFSFHHTF